MESVSLIAVLVHFKESPPAPWDMTITPNFPSAGGALLATGISKAINRHSVAGNRHSESDPVPSPSARRNLKCSWRFENGIR